MFLVKMPIDLNQDRLRKCPLLIGLKKTPLFWAVNDKVAAFFAKKAHKNNMKNQSAFCYGRPRPQLFFIVSGWIKLYRISQKGEETVINVFGPRETFAKAAVFGPIQRCPVNAQAVENTTLQCWKYHAHSS